MDCEGMPVWQACQALSEYYRVNILVYDDSKERKLYISLAGASLESNLDALAWSIGVEWIKRDGIYFVGGNANVIRVMDSAGLDNKMESIFGDKVRILGDKIVVQGTEREVKKVEDAFRSIIDRDYVRVRVVAEEVTLSREIDLGFEWETSIKYAATWSNLLTSFHPAQLLASSIAAASSISENFADSKTLFNTELGILSGSETELNIGEDIDREVYTTSVEQGTKVTSGFNTMHTGIIFKLTGYKRESSWYFDVYIENSEAKSQYDKILTMMRNKLRAEGEKIVFIGSLDKKGGKMELKKGIPYLCEIPYLSYIFSHVYTVDVKKRVYFFMQIVGDKTPDNVAKQ